MSANCNMGADRLDELLSFGPRFYNFLFKQLNTPLLYPLRLLNLLRRNGLLPSKSTDRVKRNALLIIFRTFIPSIRDMARRGRSARNVRRDRNTDNCLLSDKQASEIWGNNEIDRIQLPVQRSYFMYSRNGLKAHNDLLRESCFLVTDQWYDKHISPVIQLLTPTMKASKQFHTEEKYLTTPRPMTLRRNSSEKTAAKK